MHLRLSDVSAEIPWSSKTEDTDETNSMKLPLLTITCCRMPTSKNSFAQLFITGLLNRVRSSNAAALDRPVFDRLHSD